MNTSDFASTYLASHSIFMQHNFNLYQICLDLGLSAKEQHVYMFLTSICDHRYIVNVDEHDISRYARLNGKAVTESIRTLIKKGILVKLPDDNQYNIIINKRISI